MTRIRMFCIVYETDNAPNSVSHCHRGLKVGVKLLAVLRLTCIVGKIELRRNNSAILQDEAKNQTSFLYFIMNMVNSFSNASRRHLLTLGHRGWQIFHPPLSELQNPVRCPRVK